VKRALVLVIAAGCTTDVDQPWMLDHDRIIAVRATPPRILPGEQAEIDLLVGHASMPVEERAPDVAHVVSPASLADTLDAGTSVVTAPTGERLAAARAELGLAQDAPVPLQITVGVAAFTATKTIWLGESAQNPELTGIQMSGAAMPETDLVVPSGERIPLAIDADDTVDIVTWLTSCGEMHDFDLHEAYLTVLPEQPQEGELAVVKRDDKGGVAWRVWPIRAE
jgi:hypothetical protein